MPYFLVLILHVRTSQAYAYACAYRTSGNQALRLHYVAFNHTPTSNALCNLELQIFIVSYSKQHIMFWQRNVLLVFTVIKRGHAWT